MSQTNTRVGDVRVLAGEDLTDKEGRLVKMSHDSGVAEVLLPAANSDYALYVVTEGGADAALVTVRPIQADRNIRVNAISPGTIDTAFHAQFSSREKLEKTRLGIPLLRLGEAGDCAGTALFLACNTLSGYITGQVIEVNGGQLMI